ncbi:MAG: DUF2158 domain-containing protein [Xanthobacteraceae bacterium]
MAEERKFKVGDTCRLNSGGPLMTVAELTNYIGGKFGVNATWFDKDQKECTGSYLEEMLTADDGTT